ncbi:MAG: A24 family peptidase [Candidatus Aenigmarchaeota archaeon]|nr:A24 family peptidase [Candidatus Aenigmarchaeota archaeon]
MIEFIIIALIGSIAAGIWDLKTTEVPDEIPALMIVLGLFLWLVEGDFSSLIFSLITGTILLAVGMLMYKTKQWGGADAWMLAAIGYLIPFFNGHMFMADFLPNFLVVAVTYMVIYSIILGFRNKGIFVHFVTNIKIRWKIVFLVPAAFGLFFFLLSASLGTSLIPASFITLFVFLLMVFWAYAKTIEKYVFKKKIPTSKLRIGDVLEEMEWRGITKEELIEVRKKHKFVTIKEGVRFVPVFPIALAITLLFGNLLLALLF